jgi:1-acyl-sn-glycerol-3-phosphate acyltransferase
MGCGRFSGATRPLARDNGPGAAEPVCRPVQRAHVCADPVAQPAHAPRPHHRGQQYSECAVHDWQLGDCRCFAQSGFTIPQIFLFTGIANAVVAFYIFMLVPEYLLRFVAWVLSHFVYRFKVNGDEHIPTQGAAILVCNHVSFVDAVLLMAASPRPFTSSWTTTFSRCRCWAGCSAWPRPFPLRRAPKTPAYEAAFDAAAKVLKEGDLLCIFPEGGITRDGTLQEFKGGIMKILERTSQQGLNVQVVPMALTNLWGSFFSRVEQGGAMVRPFRRGLFSRSCGRPGRAVSWAGESRWAPTLIAHYLYNTRARSTFDCHVYGP